MGKGNNWGGVRIPSEGKKLGRPKKEPTKVLNFRVPISKYDRLKVEMNKYLEEIK